MGEKNNGPVVSSPRRSWGFRESRHCDISPDRYVSLIISPSLHTTLTPLFPWAFVLVSRQFTEFKDTCGSFGATEIWAELRETTYLLTLCVCVFVCCQPVFSDSQHTQTTSFQHWRFVGPKLWIVNFSLALQRLHGGGGNRFKGGT